MSAGEVFCLLFCCIVLLSFSVSDSCEAGCYPPADLQANLSDSLIYQLNNETTLDLEASTLAGQCFALCLNKYKDSVRPTVFYEQSGEYYSVSFDSFNGDYCTELQQVMECQSGCILRSISNNRSECRQKCHDGCLLECNGTCKYNNANTTCSRRCRRTPCRYGCEEYAENILSSHTGGELPFTPDTFLQAANSNTAGIIQLSIERSSAPNSTLVHSFVIKVQKQAEIKYLWVPSLNGVILNLRQYSCGEVSLSYAPVNMYGRSVDFSPVLDHCVRGEYIYPNQLTRSDLTYEYYEDYREGYLGNALINVTWNSSSLSLGYVTHYEVILESFSLHQVTHFTIDKYSKWFLIQASAPSLPPVFGSEYISSFIVHPVFPGAAYPRQNILEPQLLMDTPNMTLECVPLMSLNTLNVSLYWMLANESYILDTIQHFRVKITVGGTEYRDFIIDKQDGEFEYGTDVGPYPLYHPNTNKQYTIKVIATKDNNYSWRKAPKSEYCVINATWRAVPPSPVSCINSSRTGNNTYTITWCPPQESHWMLLSYQIELRGVNRIVYATENSTDYTIEVFDECKSFKIRSKNDFGYGEWSDVYQVGENCDPSTAASLHSSQHISTILGNTISPSSHYYTLTASNGISSSKTVISQSTTISNSQSTTSSSFTSGVMVTISRPVTSSSPVHSLNPSNDTFHFNATLYFLLAAITLLFILIIIMTLILVIFCLKYKKSAATTSIDLPEINKDILQDTSWGKSSPNSSNGKRAVENLYTKFECSNPV
ncbi:PREDICTED: uncharacterized protein LOC109581519 [Amphimedon queenslandica]|uniref:Fibronectin type-III domain-containing protein n=1 Tax=Amphimedon queenslandica TaxID=400682 RepID=A0A1X7VV58_AMPQE|nr:PREDICTED: uncharacterized protein LOC109581519 [Amphimedon queenslandica]|eukprot:XP_019851258.1 PREDICTED: uncharacterized protein LOC109581519 [Amphimedon queenslandica]